MRKIRSKLKRKSYNQKWKRGQSSTSNPSKTIFRDRARINKNNNTNLSFEMINSLKQNSVQKTKRKNVEDNESMYSNAQTTTVRSFFSSFSTNTNASFSKFLDCENLNERRKEMIAVLAASTETIQEQHGSETSAEYFLAFLNSLAIVDEVDRADPIIGLMSFVIKSVPTAVMQDKFIFTSGIFIKLLKTFEENDKQSGLIDVIACIGVLLSAQDCGTWKGHRMLTLLQAILSFANHSKPKIRKSAVNSILYLLKNCRSNESLKSQTIPIAVSKQVTSYCVQFFSASHLNGNPITILHILGLIERVSPYLCSDDIKAVCEGLLSLSSTSNPLIRMHCYQALYTLFESEKSQLTDVIAGRLITAVFSLQPDISDVRQTLAWITVLKKGYLFISKEDKILCSNMLPPFIKLLVADLWPTDQLEIRSAVTTVIKEVLQDIFMELVKIEKLRKSFIGFLENFLNALINPFTLCQKQVITVYATVYEVYGAKFSKELKESLKFIANKYDSEGDDRREIENTVLSGIKHLDISIVLEAIPLTDSKGIICMDRSWILPLLREGLCNSSLEYFYVNILPLASVCLKKWKSFAAAGNNNESHIYELLCCQLWGLFPGFCRQPKDVDKFSLIARTAGIILSENLYLRAPILDGFKELIPSCVADGKQILIGKYGKNFLPILFNIYITKPKGSYENDLRVNVLDIIKLYLMITPSDALDELFNNALHRLQNTNEGDFAYSMIFDIIECFAIHIDSKQLNILYDDYVKPTFSPCKQAEYKNVQTRVKKAYRVICSILSNENANCKEFVSKRKNNLEELLLNTDKFNGDNVMLTRLKCFKYLILVTDARCDSDLVKQCISEIVLCFPNNPDKPNQICTEMVKLVGTIFDDQGKLNEFVHLLLLGFASRHPDIVIKTIRSVNYIIQYFGESIEGETLNFILENIYTSIQSKNRIEAKAALCTLYTFVKYTLKETLNEHLETLLKTVSKMVPDTKRFCRLPYSHFLKKLCLYYSTLQIKKLVPGDDLVTHKLLRKIRKGLNRTTKHTDVKTSSDDEDLKLNQKLRSISIDDVLKDTDGSETDENEGKEHYPKENMKKEKTYKVCIKEDNDKILDLTDTKAISKVSFKNTKNKHEYENSMKNEKIIFKTAPDGRLIIEEPKFNKKEVFIKKTVCNVKRLRDSDDSESGIDEEMKKNNRHQRKKIMGIHRKSVLITNKHVKQSSKSNSENAKKNFIEKEKNVQPYAYLPFNSGQKQKQ